MTATNTTVTDLDEERKGDDTNSDNNEMISDAKRLGIDHRKYDFDYLLANSPFKVFNKNELHDWSRYRVYSIMQIPSHP
jgi:type I restriction-modification system DNA methylase subunit